MIMHYSIEQKRYIDVFMKHVRSGLDNDGQRNSWISAGLDNASQGIEYVSSGMQIIQTLSTAVGIAGIIAAPATLGTSIGVAGTIISVAQGGYQFYQVAQRTLGIEHAKFVPDEFYRESAVLAFEILFNEIATTLAIQYRYFLEVKATDDGIGILAKFAANQVMNQWLTLTEKKEAISIDLLIAPLYELHSYPQSRIPTKAEARTLGVTTERYYATGIYPTPRIACIDMQPNNYQWVSFETPNSKPRYGYRTDFNPPTRYRPVEQQPNWTNISPHLCTEFLVDPSSKYVITEYLEKKRNQTFTGSLNEYLSNLYGINLFASCHDDTLKGMDLSYGDFSEVNFRRADLRNCLLTGTKWHYAYLTHAFLGYVDESCYLSLANAQFNHAHIEASFWENTDFSGSLFLSAHMKGATLKHCQLGSIQHANCTWDLVQWHDMQIPDKSFLEQLQKERSERNRLEERINEIYSHVEQCEKEITRIDLEQLRRSQVSQLHTFNYDSWLVTFVHGTYVLNISGIPRRNPCIIVEGTELDENNNVRFFIKKYELSFELNPDRYYFGIIPHINPQGTLECARETRYIIPGEQTSISFIEELSSFKEQISRKRISNWILTEGGNREKIQGMIASIEDEINDTRASIPFQLFGSQKKGMLQKVISQKDAGKNMTEWCVEKLEIIGFRLDPDALSSSLG